MDKLFYLGNFSEDPIKVEDNEGRYLRKAELFSVGNHRGQDYTAADLQALVDNFNAEDDVPLQYDHSGSARDTIGFLRTVEIEGDRLLGTVEVIENSAIERIQKKLNNKLSISFYMKQTDDGKKPFRIREVSFVAFPQVKSARLFSEEGSNYVSDFDPMETINHEEVAKLDIEKMKEELQAELAEQYAEQTLELTKLREDAITFNEMQVDLKVENFAEEAKIIPAQKDSLKALLQSFSEDQMAQFEEFMKSQTKIDLNEKGEVDEQFGEQGDNDVEDKEKTEFENFYEQQAKRFGNKL